MRKILAAVAGTALAASVAVTAGSGPAAAASTGGAWPSHYSAPYVDISLYPTFNLTAAEQATGNKFFTLAFVLDVGGSCTAGWSSYTSLDSGFLQDDISSLRAAGGDVAISVGGANGSEPASSCTSAADLQAQYQRIVTDYGLTHLDFDVEGGALTDTATIDRRNQAIAGLEAANPNLKISYTLPVLPTGLTAPGVALLQNAKDDGARVDVVNIMAMDYGAANSDMGGAATSAATALEGQMASVWTDESSDQLYSRIGITPMIGQNDSAGEVFSAADASNVLSFAGAHNLPEVSFWSAGRDNGGCAGQTYASPTCSGLAQGQYDFTKQFGAYTNGSATGGSGTASGGGTTGGGSGSCPAAWSSSTAYSGGAVVSYNGDSWTAKWWTQGDVPGDNSQDVWTDGGAC